jgi:hypothetical protein
MEFQRILKAYWICGMPLGQPELRLGRGMVINNLRSWLSGPLLLSNLLAVSREVARLDGLDEPLMPELVGEGIVYPTYRVTLVN